MRLFYVFAVIIAWNIHVGVHAMQGEGLKSSFFVPLTGMLCDEFRQPVAIPAVEMDKYYVRRGMCAMLGTKGLYTCMGVAGVGVSRNEFVLALGHASSIIPAACSLLKITHELRKEGCSYNSMRIYLIGGKPDESDPSMLQIKNEYLALAPYFPIRECLFNPNNYVGNSDESDLDDSDTYASGCNIVLTPHNIFYGEDFAFKTEVLVGEDDWNDNEPLPPELCADTQQGSSFF